MRKKHTIWSSDVNLDDWRENIAEYDSEMAEKGDAKIYELACEMNSDYLADERLNLSSLEGEPIIIIADLGFWNRRRPWYKMVDSGRVSDCLYTSEDMAEWYVDEKGDFRCDVVNHDAARHYLYRRFKRQMSERQRENFKDEILAGNCTRADITRYTTSIGREIAAVYGW